MAQLQANGLQIEYDTFGHPDAEPVVLIMGLGTQMTAWTPEFCERLAQQGHYVIRFDNRDIGLSGKLDHLPVPGHLSFLASLLFRRPVKAPYSLADMAGDTAGVLDALGISSAHIVGASMGGMIGQLLAYHHPERVRSLTSLMSTSGKRGLPRARRDVTRQVFMTRPPANNREALIQHLVKTRRMIASPGYPRSDEEWREIVVAALERSFYPPGFGRQLAAVIADRSRVSRLKKIRVPTLVIHGKDDPLVPVEHGMDTARHISGARLEIIEGMGHDLPPPLDETLTSLIADHARSTLQRGDQP
jgi:pimeloyl-ACP methyl ester carboxylesterase